MSQSTRRSRRRRSLRAVTGVEADPLAPLWRASQAFRLVTLLYAASYQFASAPNYTLESVSWFFFAVMVMWTGTTAVVFSGPSVFRGFVVIADQIVVIGLMEATMLVADKDWYTSNQTLPTTLWSANAVLSAAIYWGPAAGVLSGLTLALVSLNVQDRIDADVWRDATIPLLVSAGLAIGMASSTARRAHEQLERAVRLAAATEERERLAREVHDGVLQVLAYIQRRGTEIGGAAADLAQKAGEQEIALRILISEQGTGAESDAGGRAIDLRPLLRAQARPTVSVSAPGDPVLVGRFVGTEIAAAVENALANVEQHAGAGARAYVLLEDLGANVVVTVRDDGAGIPAGRLAEAEAEGRMGVSKSIRGRIEALDGSVTLLTEPGDGTEWEFTVPRGTKEGI